MLNRRRILQGLGAGVLIPPGLMNKVALKFRRNVFPSESMGLAVLKRFDHRGMHYLLRLWGSHLSIGMSAGRFAFELEASRLRQSIMRSGN